MADENKNRGKQPGKDRDKNKKGGQVGDENRNRDMNRGDDDWGDMGDMNPPDMGDQTNR